VQAKVPFSRVSVFSAITCSQSPHLSGKSTLHTRGPCRLMDMSSSLSISSYMSRTRPYFLTYNKCHHCGLFHMSAPSPRVFRPNRLYSRTGGYSHRRVQHLVHTLRARNVANAPRSDHLFLGFSTTSSCCDTDGSPQIPTVLANCTSCPVTSTMLVVIELCSVFPD